MIARKLAQVSKYDLLNMATFHSAFKIKHLPQQRLLNALPNTVGHCRGEWTDVLHANIKPAKLSSCVLNGPTCFKWCF